MKALFFLRAWKPIAALIFVTAFISGIAQAQRPLGVDASVYQGTSVNWTMNKSSGITFAWSRADEGTGITDNTFAGNMNNGKAAGVYMGGYHFAEPNDYTPAAEATHFWGLAGGYIKSDGLSLMPMLDMEVFSGLVGASTYSVWANTWCTNIVANAAANGVRIKPFIYCSACNLHNFDTSISQWFSDIANYNGEGAQSGSPWDLGTACAADYLWGTGVWHVWQYNDTASLPGFPSEQPDVDVYNGTAAALFSTSVATSTGPVITSQTPNTNVVPGANATITVTASGTGTVSYQWAFNGTNISGATSSSYTITNMQMAKAGGYAVTLTDTTPTPTVSPGTYVGLFLPVTNGPVSVIAPQGLVNWWTFDGNPTDLYGTNDLLPKGVVTYANGMTGSAIHFDGTSTLLVSGAADLPVPWTACLWVNRQNTSQTSAGLFENGTDSLKLEQYNGTHEVGLSILSVGDYIFGSGYIVPTGTWTHLAFVGTTAGVSFYANGVLKGTLTNTFSLPRMYIGGAFYAGSGEYLDQLNGNLDEVMIFNKALTVPQIGSIYSAGVSGVVKAPQIMSANVSGPNLFTIYMQGLTGKNYTVYYSTNLTNWSLLTGLSNVNGSNHLTDQFTNYTQKFYRISQSY